MKKLNGKGWLVLDTSATFPEALSDIATSWSQIFPEDGHIWDGSLSAVREHL